MTLKGNAKFDNSLVARKMTRNLVNFVQAVESLKICTLMVSFVQSI